MKIIRKNQENIFPFKELQVGDIFEFAHIGAKHIALKTGGGTVFCFNCKEYNSVGNTVHDMIKDKDLVEVLDCELHVK